MSRRTVLAGIAAIFAAMLGRMGWVDWLRVAEAACWMAASVLFVGVVLAILVGVPVLMLWGLLRLFDRPTKPTRPAPPAAAPAR